MSRKVSRPLAAGTDTVVPSVVSGMGTRKRWATVAATAVTALVLSGCGTVASLVTRDAETSTPTRTSRPVAIPTLPTRTPTTTTAPSAPSDPLAEEVNNAADIIDRFWEGVLGQQISVDVSPFDSRTGDVPTCGGEPYGRAGFCAMKTGNDKIKWDRAAFEPMEAEGGDLAIAIAIGHEFGHEVQDIMAVPRNELQADCLSGAFTAVHGKEFSGTPQPAMGAVFGNDNERLTAFVAGTNNRAAPLKCLAYSP